MRTVDVGKREKKHEEGCADGAKKRSRPRKVTLIKLHRRFNHHGDLEDSAIGEETNPVPQERVRGKDARSKGRPSESKYQTGRSLEYRRQ